MAKPIVSESKNILKNMLITVATTVLGATAVYFLGFSNKKSGFTKLEQEAITVDAWKTYVTVENLYTKNSISLLRDVGQYGSFSGAYDETEKESKKFTNSLNRLLQVEGLDKDFISLLERRVDNEYKALPVGKKLYHDIDSMIQYGVDHNWNQKTINDSAMKRMTDHGKRTEGMLQRALADIEDLSKTLSERYDTPFNMNDFILIQIYKNGKDPLSYLETVKPAGGDPDPINGGTKAGNGNESALFSKQYFTGQWSSSGAVITLSADNKMRWVANATDSTFGTWRLEGEQLVMNAINPKTKKEVEWTFNVANLVQKSFSMMLVKPPYNSYLLTRL